MKKKDKNDKNNQKEEENKKYKILLRLNKYKYFPSEEIEGTIIIHPNENMESDKALDFSEICFTFKQKMAFICLTNNLQQLDLDEKKVQFDNIERDHNTNDLKIPTKYKIPDITTKNFTPSFRYFSPSLKCIVGHTLSVEIPNLSNKSAINVFIKKPPLKEKDQNNNKIKEELNKCVFGEEIIKKIFTKIGRLSYYIKTKKSIHYKEKLPVEVNLDTSQLGSVEIESITMSIKKHLLLFDFQCVNSGGGYLDKHYDTKKIIFKNSENYSITEYLELPKDEFETIKNKDIHKPNILEGKCNFTPPLSNDLFKCEYCLTITFILHDKMIKDKTISIPIDLYDNEIDQKNDKKDEDDIDIVNYGIGSINEMNEDDEANDDIFRAFERESVRKRNDKKIYGENETEHNGFVVFDNDDFMRAFRKSSNQKKDSSENKK